MFQRALTCFSLLICGLLLIGGLLLSPPGAAGSAPRAAGPHGPTLPPDTSTPTLTATSIAATSTAGAPTATATVTTTVPCLSWAVIPSPNGTLTDTNYLNSIAAVAADNIWAVGYYGHYTVTQTLIEHWNGNQWSLVPSPNPSGNDLLNGVAAASANDVWAVGTQAFHVLIMHWDGTQWTVVPVGNGVGVLRAVTVIASDDVWAVGDYQSGVYSPMLFMHWDGHSWTNTLIADSALHEVTGVVGLAPNDVWAVGWFTQHFAYGMEMAHWDGTSWSNVTPTWLPSSSLHAVAAAAPNDIWAVGSNGSTSESRHPLYPDALIEHWDGTTWSTVNSPPVPPLSGVTALGPNDAWAVSSDGSIIHWDGTRWSTVPDPQPGASSTLNAITAVAPGNLWAVGEYAPTPNTPALTLIEHYPEFADMATRDPFYSYVHCLVCRGILSGYDDGTFRGGAAVTRGQAAKIVANAAGYNEVILPTQQTYTDVPYGSPFWLYVERASLHGVFNGYSSSPPCTTGVPCFLPANNLTRGQLAKIDANAAGYGEAVSSTQQTFADVPFSSPFWVYIERIAGRQIISGYQCGALGEPCDPQQRPYFRPANNVTRGQTAKIVANTFFPNCSTLGK